MGNTVSSNFTLLRRFVEHEGGPAAWQKVWAGITADERDQYQRIAGATWGPYPLFFRLLEEGAAALGCDGPSLARRYGAYQVQHDVPLLLRTAIRFGGPGLLVMEAGSLWKRYHDSGVLEVYDVLPGSARARLSGIDGGGPLLCSLLQGFSARGVELAGGRNVADEHTSCIYRGDAECLFHVHWDPMKRPGQP